MEDRAQGLTYVMLMNGVNANTAISGYSSTLPDLVWQRADGSVALWLMSASGLVPGSTPVVAEVQGPD